VSNEGPKEAEYSSAYILFYERKGIRHNINETLEKCRTMPERNIPSFGDRSRAVGIVPPTKTNHHSGGNVQENLSSTKSPISTLTLGNHGVYNDGGGIRSTDSVGNNLDELSLRMACPKSSPSDSGNYPHAIPSLKHALEDECGSSVSNSSDWETEDKGDAPTLRNQSAIHQGNTSSDSGMEDNQENNTPEEAGPSGDGTSSKPINSNRMLNFSRSRPKNDLSQN
jgi:hypothetical protein